MASTGRNNFIWIAIIAIVVIGVGGYYAGWWGVGLGHGEICHDPDGCQCGLMTKCGPAETCDRTGPFGSCRAP